MENPRRYLGTLLAVVATVLVATAATNLIVDPYDIWGFVTLGRLNGNRPEGVFHDRLHKAHEIRRQPPNAILLGTSRTQVGLNPHSQALQSRGYAAVNSALSDGQPWEAWRYLQHAEGLSPLRLAVVGLDYLSFDTRTPPNVEYLDARLSTDAEGRPQPLSAWADALPTLLSETALRASLHTVRRQQEPSYFFEGGQRNPVFMQARQDEQGGMRRAMLFSERDYLGSFACYEATDGSGYSRPLADLANLVATCKARGIALRLFFSPSHARSELVIEEAGLWPSLEAWKRGVVDVVAGAGQDADVQLWDFTGAGRFTGEEVPPLEDTDRRMQWYWESSHYKSALGDRVLDRLLGEPDADPTDPFGEWVTTTNVEEDLARVRRELANFRRQHPDAVREISTLAAEVLPAARAVKQCAAPATARPWAWRALAPKGQGE